MDVIIKSVGLLFQWALMLIFGYYIVISVFAWKKRKEVSPENFPVKHRFAMIVAAHNEEMVIGAAVRSLKSLNYPKNMYDIFVIADNCDDETARVARENGAKVHERFDKVKRGKGYSLEWMFKRLFEMDKHYDGVCILDADNLVSPNFLMEMNKHMCLGHKVIQGYLDSKNSGDSWISGNNSIAFWISNRLIQLPRYYLGLSCILGGTGFVVATDVLKEFGWGATCLAEDLEFSLKLVSKGMKVYWAHDAVIYDEKPLTIAQSWRQRKRWMQGHFDCFKRFFVKLVVKAFKEKDVIALDLSLYLLQPLVVVVNGIGFIGMLLRLAVNPLLPQNLPENLKFLKFSVQNPIAFTALMIVLAYINLVFVIVEGKMTKKVLKSFVSFPLYNLTWVPIIIQGFLNRNKKEWVHTLHTRSLDISDIHSLEKVG